MTTQGGSSAHELKREPTTPASPAPARNPDHMPASIRARDKWESLGLFFPSGRGFRPTAAARWPPILLSVPVTNVRLTGSAPTLERAGFIIPIDRLSMAIRKSAF